MDKAMFEKGLKTLVAEDRRQSHTGQAHRVPPAIG